MIPRTLRKVLKRSCIAAAGAALLQFFASTHAQEIERLTTAADPARVAAFVTALEHNLPYVPGEMLVRYRSGTRVARQLSALTAVERDVSAVNTRWLGETALITGLPPDDPEHQAAILRLQPEIEYAHPNYIQHLHAIPNDPLFTRQWNMTEINMPQAWDINVSAGRGVIVAVLDSGLTSLNETVGLRFPLPPLGLPLETFSIPFRTNPDLDFSHVLSGAEFTPTGPWSLASGQRALFDAEGHGTHVAGTINEWTNNNFGFTGIASGATLLPIKVCVSDTDVIMAWGRDLRIPAPAGGCDVAGVIQGIRYAVDNGARVVNLSLGGPQPAPAYVDALRYAVSKGAFVAISVGNDALNGNATTYPATYAESISGVVAVGATTPRRTRALYSNFGSYVELVAPGGEGGGVGVDRHCGADSEVIWQIGPNAADLYTLPPRFDRYVEMPDCGTSMASPHVAGAAALLYSQGVTDPAAIEAALERFAVDLGTAGRDPEFGYGLLDVRAALRGLGVVR